MNDCENENGLTENTDNHNLCTCIVYLSLGYNRPCVYLRVIYVHFFIKSCDAHKNVFQLFQAAVEHVLQPLDVSEDLCDLFANSTERAGDAHLARIP